MLSHVCVQIFFRFKFLRHVHRVLFVSKDLIYDYKFEICFKTASTFMIDVENPFQYPLNFFP